MIDEDIRATSMPRRTVSAMTTFDQDLGGPPQRLRAGELAVVRTLHSAVHGLDTAARRGPRAHRVAATL
jgi:hypothetical protein